MIGSIVGKVISGIVTTVLGWLGIYRAGEKAQHTKDLAAAHTEDVDARKIDAKIATLDDTAVDNALERLRTKGRL